MTQTVEITPKIKVGAGNKLLLIAGPCQIESRDHALAVAEQLKKICAKFPINLVYKSSFDKANRTSVQTKRGPGIDEGLKILEEVRKETGLPVLTDIHTVEQARMAAEVVDILQTPAFLCRQTDLLIAAGATGKAVNVKKGQFLHPEDMRYVAEKVAFSGNKRIMLCERGSSLGYRDLVVDMRALVIMAQIGYPVIYDATHSVQSLGGVGGSSGGSPQFIVPLIRAAVAVGIDGLFIECHNDPLNAPSDGPSMLPLSEMEKVLEMVVKIRSASL